MVRFRSDATMMRSSDSSPWFVALLRRPSSRIHGPWPSRSTVLQISLDRRLVLDVLRCSGIAGAGVPIPPWYDPRGYEGLQHIVAVGLLDGLVRTLLGADVCRRRARAEHVPAASGILALLVAAARSATTTGLIRLAPDLRRRERDRSTRRCGERSLVEAADGSDLLGFSMAAGISRPPIGES